MRRAAFLTAAVLLASVLLTGCGSGSAADNGRMRSDLTAAAAAQEMGVGINLGNTMEAYWLDEKDLTAGASTIGDDTPQDYEKCWGAVVTTPECIDGMEAAGFNCVRIPVYWGNMMADDGTYTINKDYLDRVQEIVDYARADGLYVILNCHHYDEFLIKHHSEEEVLAATAHVWKQIAERFKGYSDYLVFEGFNEALGTVREGDSLSDDEIYAYVNAMNQTFVDTVRKTGGNNAKRIMIASGYWTNIDLTTAEQYQMPQDTVEDRMMVSVHYIDNAIYWTNMIGNDRWLQYAQSQCELLQERFTDNGIPVFVGECTSIYDAEHMIKKPKYDDSSECLGLLLDMAADYGFVPVLWDVNDNFYSRTDCRIKQESDQAVITEVAGRIASR